MPHKSIITGQHIQPERIERSKELRRQMTPAESKLWKYLRAGRLDGFHFRRQQVIDGFIVDFYCHQANLVIEVDGGVHLEQEEYDQERENHLRSRGLSILRFTNQEVNREVETVLSVILDACIQHEQAEEMEG